MCRNSTQYLKFFTLDFCSALVVYHIKWSECSADYIGKTERILPYMIKEHQSPKKDKKGNYLSSVYEHHKITQNWFQWNKNLRSRRLKSKNQSQRDTAYRQEKAKFKHPYNSQTEFRYNVNIVGSKKKK